MTQTECQLKARQRVLASEIAEIESVLDERMRNKLILCERCGKRTRVRDLVYIQTHFYIHPYSCTGGDYWMPGEGQYDCPKCGRRNRLYNRSDVAALKRFFKKVVETHER